MDFIERGLDRLALKLNLKAPEKAKERLMQAVAQTPRIPFDTGMVPFENGEMELVRDLVNDIESIDPPDELRERVLTPVAQTPPNREGNS